MTLTSLAAAVVPCTGRIIKNRPHVFERGENPYKMMYYTLSIVTNRVAKLEFNAEEKPTFLKGAWHLKG